MTRSIRPGLLAAAVAAALMTVAACGDDDEPAYCGDRRELQQSFDELRQTDLRADEIDALRSRLTEVQRDAEALVDSARSEFGPETAALRSAVASLGTAVEDAAAAPSAAAISQVTTRVSAVGTALDDLVESVSTTC